ncbi:hypothetical protein OG884_21145 [Streptosporangium sp. NBC_01755]|uniref:hypothetical protein n=1 Tax=unclassified Streptosporangium TaxID=2632669 RepID=UPI002DD8F321|nr:MULTISPECIES: hypothetical protein [unclassified Streptosporangium]WSA24527.1 hypothetical protein OIE13_26780 [Streptosporangium sp. NBC_01810]WSC97399.1 hypothetical protein OG884_21145 [Streptosporangium sp. NBC_01755]
MDAKSPAAAASLSRPSPPLTTAAEPSRTAVALRRTGIAIAGVGVTALTAAACVLSFEDLRALALAGRAPAGLAYLYPAAFDALLVVAMIGVLLLRGGWWPVRLQAGVILTLLFAGATTAEVATAMRMAVDEQRAAVVVAVAPWVMLILALWLWLLLIKHAAARRAATDAALVGRPASGHDIVPFPEAGRPSSEHPGVPAPEERRQGPGHPGQLVHHPAAEIMLDPHAAPPLETAPHHDLPTGEPVVGPTAAPETPEITDVPQSPPLPRRPTAPRPGKPMRWGDLIRPRQGDLLVHPPRSDVRVTEEEPGSGGRISERVETWDTDAGVPRERGSRASEPGTAEAGPPDTTRHGTTPRDTTRRDTTPRDADEVSERDADTQPILAVKDRAANVTPGRRTAGTAAKASTAAGKADVTDGEAGDSPAHGAEAAETGETGEEAQAREEDGIAAPPSGRMRSTPVPPGE